MPCASRRESRLSASVGPPVMNAKEAHFRKHEISSYSLCILKVMLQEPWSSACLCRAAGHVCQRRDLYSEPAALYQGSSAWLPFLPCLVSTLGKARPSEGRYVPFQQQSKDQRTSVRQNGILKTYQPTGSDKTKPYLLHNYLSFSCSSELSCVLSTLTVPH